MYMNKTESMTAYVRDSITAPLPLVRVSGKANCYNQHRRLNPRSKINVRLLLNSIYLREGASAKDKRMKKAITYYRVSTERQGISGLGLDAQRQAVHDFAEANGFSLASEYIEVESGRKQNRPVLLQALSACRKEKATLLIARLDRLGRNVAFISKLMEAGVDFKAVDNPYAGKLVVHIMAAFAEHERDMISQRTTEALKVAKEKGVELGRYGRYELSVKNKREADRFARTLKPVLDELRQHGITTIRAITDELNRKQVPTYRGNARWHISTVYQVMKRLEKRTNKE